MFHTMMGTCGGCGCGVEDLSREERLAMLERKERMIEKTLKFVREEKEALKAAKAPQGK